MKSGLSSNLTSGLGFKNEVKSVITVQQGAKYGFVLEISSPMGTYYCPVEGYKSRDVALQLLRKRLK